MGGVCRRISILGFAVFFDLFRFSGHGHFLVKQTLGLHFRRNPLSRNSWRKRDPVSKEKDDTYPISRNGSEARRSRFFCSLPLVPTLLRTAAPLPASHCCLRCERYWICSVSKRAFPFWCCSSRIAILVLHSFSFQRSLSLFGKTNSRDTFPTQSIVSLFLAKARSGFEGKGCLSFCNVCLFFGPSEECKFSLFHCFIDDAAGLLCNLRRKYLQVKLSTTSRRILENLERQTFRVISFCCDISHGN